MKNKIIAIVFSLLGTVCLCSPIKSMLGADRMEIVDGFPEFTYIEDGLVWMWSQNDGELLDEKELSMQLIDMYNGGDFTIDIAYVNSDTSVTGPQIGINGFNCLVIGPRNAASTGQTPIPRPYMRYDATDHWITYQYPNPLRLAMSATLSSVIRYWGETSRASTVERSIVATSAAIYNKNSLGKNKIACILIYDRALSEDEMQYNYMIHKLEFGNDNQ